MNWFKNKKLHILFIYLNILFILGVMRVCYDIQDFNYALVTFWFFIALIIYWFYQIILLKPKHKFIFILIAIIALSAYSFYSKDFINNFFVKGIIENIDAINTNLVKGRINNFYQFQNIFMIMIPLISIITLFLDSKGLLNIIVFINISILLFLWYLGYTDGVKLGLTKFIVLSITTYALNDNDNYLKKLSKSGIKLSIENGSIISQIIVIAIIISGIILFLPQEYEGKYGKLITDKFINRFSVNPNEQGTSSKGKNSNQFKLSFSGYSDSEKKLGGKITLSSVIAFRVDSIEAYHLKGSAKDIYTGSSWRNSNVTYENSNIINSIRNRGEYMRVSKKSMYIYPDKLNIYTMFVPNNAFSISLQGGNVYNNSENGVYLNDKPVENPYQIEFYDEKSIDPKINQQIVTRGRNRYTGAFYSKYTQVPDSVTDRTKELVYKIVEGAQNDLEKVERIKNYLSKNYSYSLEVSDVPADADFVDYFLFNEKKGYCVYFATATTIMLRITGIPARYVEGFKMPPKAGADGFYTVTNEDAHAWTEVCLDSDQEVWSIADCSSTPTEIREQSTQNSSGESTIINENENIDPRQKDKKPQEEEASNQQNNKSYIDIQGILMYGTVLLIIIYLIIRNGILILRKNKIVKTNSIIPLYEYVLKRLKTIGIAKSSFETDMEFVNNLPTEELRKEFKPLVNQVYREYYGGYKDSDVDKVYIYKYVEQYIKESKNTLVYYLRRYII